ncbi:hypothetical protein M413DRAFT_448405 [Hebeloma cylindrosporum]|uniref:Uncharacterized protein n=1 Tax=Hebeloma cylindrosporum TaxID=76867 RepID=A0A0C3C1Y8_HEBCY|nr:hypothetical protein M413DRAFT_448405 [Hebeloma cylindrosporum h7]
MACRRKPRAGISSMNFLEVAVVEAEAIAKFTQNTHNTKFSDNRAQMLQNGGNMEADRTNPRLLRLFIKRLFCYLNAVICAISREF